MSLSTQNTHRLMVKNGYHAARLNDLTEALESMMEKLIESMLVELGEDPTREGLERTPHRVAKSMKFLIRGYEQSVKDVIGQGIFNENHEEMVICRDIDFFSLCEHHMLPFFGK